MPSETSPMPLSKTLQCVVWGGLAGLVFWIGLRFAGDRVLLAHAAAMPVYSTVKPFALTNHLGAVTRSEDLLGRVWVADIVFSRCPGPCPRMTGKMAELQKAWPAASGVRFVTLTSDPGHDTPVVLRAFAGRFGVDDSRWHFLTGPKKEIISVAMESLKLTALDKEEAQRDNPDDLFIHSTVFMVVDKRGRVRASIESLEPDFMTQARLAIDSLLKEP